MRRAFLGLVALLLAVPAALAAAASAAPVADGPRWVTGWQAAPHGNEGVAFQVGGAAALVSYPLGFVGQTIRHVITPHAAGSQARVVLSNAFGTLPLTVSATSLGRRVAGAAVDPATLVPVTFGGDRSVTIPAGAVVRSDPAVLGVAPFEDVAVSLAFATLTAPPTYHSLGLQTSYVTPVGTGDRTATADGGPFTAVTPARFFLAGLEVLAAAPARTLVAVGDSITDGGIVAPDTTDRSSRWPDALQRRLLAAGSALSVANAGISGNQLTEDAGPFPAAGPSVEHRLDRDVLDHPNLAGVVVAAGLNDLGLSRASAAQVIGGLTRVAGRVKARGLPVFVTTLTPSQGAFYDSSSVQTERAAVNAWIRGQEVFDGVVDVDAAIRDPGRPARMQAAFDSGDQLHPSAAGLAAMAGAFDLPALRTAMGETMPSAAAIPVRPTLTVRRRGGCLAPRLELTLRVSGADRLRGAAVRIGGRPSRGYRLSGRRARILVRPAPRAAIRVRVRITATRTPVTTLVRRIAACRR